MKRIKGLTLKRPWGWAIKNLDKRVENRSQRCFLDPGDYIAFHNGKKWDSEGASFLDEINPSGLMENPTEADDEPGLIVCIARFVGNIDQSDSEWFFGPWGWIFDNVVPIDNVRVEKGQQGLWNLSPETLISVREQYRKNVHEIFW
jgi:hypothetical protein